NMPRRRGAKKRGWPERLYERDGYYTWRDPRDRKEYGLGRDRSEAFAQAVEANLQVAGLLANARLVERISGTGNKSFGDWCDRYTLILADRELAKDTRADYDRRVQLVRDRWGTHKIECISVK